MWNRLGCAILMTVALTGCSRDLEPTREELRARWEAQNVFPDNYKADVLAFMRTYLNDPTRVRSAAATVPVRKPAGMGERYIVCVRYDARNVDGRYMGLKTGFATFVSGKLERYFDVATEVTAMCKDMTFVPFPELEALKR